MNRIAALLIACAAPAAAGVTPLEQDAGFNDEPSMVRTSDGSIYVAWNSFRDGADSLQVARYEVRADQFRSIGSWQVAGGPNTYVLGPKVIAADDRVFVVYAAETARNWNIFAVPCGPEGPGKPVEIGSHSATDIKPDGFWRGGTLWVSWESNRNRRRQIFLASLRNGKVSPAEAVSDDRYGGYGPSLAVAPNGRISVAWHSFRQNNYDVFLRQRSAKGEWDPERRLTLAASIDRHPALIQNQDDLWLIYENAQTEGYLIGRTYQRRIMLAKITPRGLASPKDYREGSPLYGRCEAAAAAFDSLGRMWVAYLRPRLPRGGWDLYFTGFNGQAWEPAQAVSSYKGMDRRPSIAVHGSRAILAFQVDDLPESWASARPDRTDNAKSRILLASIDLSRSAAPAPMALDPLVEPAEAFDAGRLRVEFGEDLATPAIQYQGKTLKLFYGDLHTHSDVSVCHRCGDQSIDENYQHRRDINRLDFACSTDHGYNIIPYLWNHTAKLARANEDPGRLLTFLAQEWTSEFKKRDEKHPYGYYGHRNLILADPFFPRWFRASTGQTPAELWAELRRMKANFVNIPHQLADTGNVPTDWSFADEEAQPVAEIFQVRGSYEYKGAPREAIRSTPQPGYFIQDAWERGVVIGVIASPDHGGGAGKACVYAEDLSRESVLAAIRARRTFGATAARIFLDVRINGHLMGEKIASAKGKPVEVKIGVRCPTDIARVEVCRNNRFIYVNEPAAKSADLVFLDTEPLPGRSYYYVRVIQKDKEMAWSSPVWLGVD